MSICQCFILPSQEPRYVAKQQAGFEGALDAGIVAQIKCIVHDVRDEHILQAVVDHKSVPWRRLRQTTETHPADAIG